VFWERATPGLTPGHDAGCGRVTVPEGAISVPRYPLVRKNAPYYCRPGTTTSPLPKTLPWGCQMSGSITAQSLLHGAVYSLEHCGLLLGDAKLLYENGSYATALSVAAFAREELGRGRILLKLRKQVLADESFTVEDVKTAYDDHVRKQEAGMTSLTMRADNASGLGKLLQTRAKAPLGSKERQEADKQVDKIDRLKSKRTPDDRHRLRMKALYVDILSEEQWNRPAQEILPTEAYEFLNDTINEYGMRRERYMNLQILKANDPDEIHDALAQWSDRPQLPHVEHLPYPAAA